MNCLNSRPFSSRIRCISSSVRETGDGGDGIFPPWLISFKPSRSNLPTLFTHDSETGVLGVGRIVNCRRGVKFSAHSGDLIKLLDTVDRLSMRYGLA